MQLSDHDGDVSPRSSKTTNKQQKDVSTLEYPTPKRYTVKVPLKGAATQPTEESPNGRITRSKPSASPSTLPSTIPDSLAARKAAMASQSEGDTQPLSVNAFEEYRDKVHKEHSEATSGIGTDCISRTHTCQPGESGYINVVENYEQLVENETEGAAEIQDDDVDPEPDSQSADVRVELFPESRRFQQPITPATTSRKRQRIGSSISREKVTPTLPINPFAGQAGGLDGMMNASQAFKATQFTSPILNGIPSDALSERPSPDIINVQRPSTAEPISSPVHLPRSRMTRSRTEPQTTYISMEESQAERERVNKLHEMEQARAQRDELDDEFDSEDSEFRRRRRLRKLDMDSRDQLAMVTAKARPGPSRRGRGGRNPQTPRAPFGRQSHKLESEAVIISDSPVEDDNVTEDETEKEQDHSEESDLESPDELSEENKENYNYKALRAPMTTSRVDLPKNIVNAVHMKPSVRYVRRSVSPKVGARNHRATQAGHSSRSTDPIEEIPAASATVAIADSQPTHPNDDDPPKIPQEQTEVSESSPDQRLFVPQSQFSRSSNEDPSRRDTVTGPRQLSLVPASSVTSTTQGQKAEQENLKSRILSSDTEGLSKGSYEISRLTGSAASSARLGGSPQVNNTVRPHVSNEHSGNGQPTGDGSASNHSDTLLHKTSPRQQKQPKGIDTVADTSSAEMQDEISEGPLVSSAPPASTNTSRVDSRLPSSQTNNAPSTLFETAPTNIEVTPSKPFTNTVAQSPLNTTSTPTSKSTRPRSMIEIATAASPIGANHYLDVDIDLMTADDVEYQAVIKGSSPIGPARKRRRGRTGRAVHLEEPQLHGPPTSNVPTAQVQDMDNRAVNSSNAAKDQLETGDVHPIAPGNSNHISPLSKISKPPLPAETPRKRGRPRKTTASPIPPTEPNVVERRKEASPLKASRAELPRIQTDTARQEGSEGSLNNALVVAPNRVFAYFNGSCAAYYPATCIGQVGGERSRYRVRFDDGTVDDIDGFGIKRLELRPGDHVKLDFGGNRKKIYIVIRMQDRQQPMLTPDPETPTRHTLAEQALAAMSTQTDIKGYATVVVAPKQATNVNQETVEQLTVPVRDVYFTQMMWTGLKDRSYTYNPVRSRLSSRMETPLERSSIPSTPSSRAHRIRASGLGTSKSTKPSSAIRSNLFENMVFAITNITDPNLRDALNDLVSNNGGQLLRDDFSELFHIPSFGPITPSKRSPKRDTDSTFHLTTAASRKGFTCLIAEKHCRKAKYIQALALGLPCLSPRWVQDCVARQVIVPWEHYLLAAGESSFLNGAVRSRVIPPINALTTTLSDIIEARTRLLENASVLLIMEKSEEDTMQPYPLLSHALGARKVSRATSFEAAAGMVAAAENHGEAWDWVYSHDKEEKAEKVLFGGGKSASGGAGKKRKRGGSVLRGSGEGKEKIVSSQTASAKAQQSFRNTGTRVVGNEFVIQSLILGKLIDRD